MLVIDQFTKQKDLDKLLEQHKLVLTSQNTELAKVPALCAVIDGRVASKIVLPADFCAMLVDGEPIIVPQLEVAKSDAIFRTRIQQVVSAASQYIEQNIRAAFNKYDTDNSGLIDQSEFMALINSLGFNKLTSDETA